MNKLLPQLFLDLTQPGAEQALNVASHYLINMILSLPILYLVYVHRSALQGTGDSIWSLVSGILEALVRVVIAKVVFAVLGTGVLFWSEPLSWLAAWLFVLIPYCFYQKKHLRINPKDTVL